MRLLYVCSDFGIQPSGTKGASIHLRAITRALAALGHDVQLLSPLPGPGDDHPVRRLLPPGCPLMDKAVKPLKHFLLEHDLGDDLPRDLRSLYYSAYAPQAAVDELAAGTPDAIIERLSLFSTVGLDLARICNRPLVLEVNALLTEEAQQYRTLVLRDLARIIQQRTLEQADAIIAVSDELAQRLIAIGIPPEKIHVAPNGADNAFFEVAPQAGVLARQALGLDGAFVVGFVGSLKPWHGVDVLLRAAALLDRKPGAVKVLIVGTGPEDERLRRLAGELGIAEDVVFTGAMEHARIPPLIAAMDVAVAPFRAIDSFYFSPIKLFEYMAAGACVLASRLGQIASVIEHGIDGLLCEPDNPDALASGIQSLWQSKNLRRRLGDAARAKAERRFNWRHTAELVMDVVQSRVAARTESRSDTQRLTELNSAS